VPFYDSSDPIDPIFRAKINSVLHGRRLVSSRLVGPAVGGRRFRVRSGRICHATRRFVHHRSRRLGSSRWWISPYGRVRSAAYKTPSIFFESFMAFSRGIGARTATGAQPNQALACSALTSELPKKYEHSNPTSITLHTP